MRGLICSLAVCTLIAWGGAARADDVGAIGTPVALQVHTDDADGYLQFHGRLFVKNTGGTLDEYRWGGTSCGSRTLTEAQVASLHRGIDNKRMQIQPIHQPGQGQTLCLVGFELVPKSFVKLVIP
jgi:hypothetical protein